MTGLANFVPSATEVAELGALGAAMCAGIGSELFTDCYDAVAKCVKVTKVYQPTTSKVPDYEAAFKVWERCYTISNEQIYI